MKRSKRLLIILSFTILIGGSLFLFDKWRVERVRREYIQWWDMLSKEEYSKLEIKVPESVRKRFAPVSFRQRYEGFRSEEYSPANIERITLGQRNASIYFVRKAGIGRTLEMGKSTHGWYVDDTIGFWASPFWD